MTTIKDWPDQERPREKLLSKGSSALSDAELLAIFLRTGCKGIDVVALSRSLLNEFGSLHAIFAASEADFCAKKGLGQAKYVQLQAVLEMSRRYLQEPLQKGEALTSAQQTKDFLIAKMHAYPHEVFAAILLDTQHQIICFHEFFYGSIDSQPSKTPFKVSRPWPFGAENVCTLACCGRVARTFSSAFCCAPRASLSALVSST